MTENIEPRFINIIKKAQVGHLLFTLLVTSLIFYWLLQEISVEIQTVNMTLWTV